jgi:hypothetical protein
MLALLTGPERSRANRMFGPSASLASPTPHEDWGLLPRIVDASLKHMAEHADSADYKLALSAVEFYCFAAWDLNAAQRNLVTMTPNGDVFGHTSTEISSVAEIATFIERVYGNRKVMRRDGHGLFSYLIPSHPIPSHLISSHLISSHLR